MSPNIIRFARYSCLLDVQPNLSLVRDSKLLGHVKMVGEHDIVYARQHGAIDTRLDTHVLQSVYNSLKDYLTVGAQVPDMSEIIWDIISQLHVRSVTVLYIFNGAAANWKFIFI